MNDNDLFNIQDDSPPKVIKNSNTNTNNSCEQKQVTKQTNENSKTSADYYFDSYSHFGIHEEMLKDTVRTGTYHKAIVTNPQLFKNKIVLDIGCGTGILCLFAAKAGAKKVYGIECASIAVSAEKIVAENGYSDIITIIKGKVEEIELDVKADVIISEWMGYFLLYESMLNTVLFARDKWLVDGGIIMPDRANLYLTAIEDGDYMQDKIHFWNNVYGFSMNCLKEEAMKEPLVDIVPAKCVITDSQRILSLDLYKAKISDLEFECDFQLRVKCDDYIHAFVAYFDVDFSKCHTRVGFSTAPYADYTHWKQTVFYLDRVLMVDKGGKIYGKIKVSANLKNPRDLDILMSSEYGNKKSEPIVQQRMYHMR